MTTATCSLGFLLFPGFPMACLTSAIEPLRAANEITGRREFSWTLVGEEAAPIRSSAEVRFDPDMALADVKGLDCLMLLSSPTARFENPRKGNAQLRWLDRTGMVLGGGVQGRVSTDRGQPLGHHPRPSALYRLGRGRGVRPDAAADRGTAGPRHDDRGGLLVPASHLGH